MAIRTRQADIDIPIAQVGGAGVNAHVTILTQSCFLVNAPNAITAGHVDAMQADGGDLLAHSDAARTQRLALDILPGFSLNANPALSVVQIAIQNSALSNVSANTLYLSWKGDGAESQPAAAAAFGQHAVYETAQKLALPFEEGSGTAANDRTSNANNGTLQNGPTWGTGKVGSGIEFAGPTQGVYVNQDFDFTSGGTFAAWVKTSEPATRQTVFNNVVTSLTLLAIQQASNTMIGGWYTGSYNAKSGTLSDTNFHHVAFTLSGSTSALYIDGVAQVGTSTPQSGVTAGKSMVGRRIDDNTMAWVGTIDQPSIWLRALSQDEITTIHNNQNAPGTFAVVGPITVLGTIRPGLRTGGMMQGSGIMTGGLL